MEGEKPLKDDCMISKRIEDGLAPSPLPWSWCPPHVRVRVLEQEFMHFGVGYTNQPYFVTVYLIFWSGPKPVTNRSFPYNIWVPGSSIFQLICPCIMTCAAISEHHDLCLQVMAAPLPNHSIYTDRDRHVDAPGTTLPNHSIYTDRDRHVDIRSILFVMPSACS